MARLSIPALTKLAVAHIRPTDTVYSAHERMAPVYAGSIMADDVALAVTREAFLWTVGLKTARHPLVDCGATVKEIRAVLGLPAERRRIRKLARTAVAAVLAVASLAAVAPASAQTGEKPPTIKQCQATAFVAGVLMAADDMGCGFTEIKASFNRGSEVCAEMVQWKVLAPYVLAGEQSVLLDVEKHGPKKACAIVKHDLRELKVR